MHPELLNNPTFLRYFDMWQRDTKSLVFAPLADFFCQHKLYADARKVCEAGVKHNPNSVLAHYSLAKAYICTREWHSARHEAQWVLGRVAGHQGALNVLHQVEQHQVPTRHIVVQPEVTPAILSADLVRVEELTREQTVQNNKLAEAMAAAGGSLSPSAASAKEAAVFHTDDVADEDDVVEEDSDEDSVTDETASSEDLPMMRRDLGRGAAIPEAPAKTIPANRAQKLLPWQTVTMAKIYSQQGLLYKARTIYKTILSRDPQNTEAQAGLVTLERMIRDAAA